MKTIELPFHTEGVINPQVFNERTAVFEASLADTDDELLSYVDTLLKLYGLEVVIIDGGGTENDMSAFRIDRIK